MLTVALNLQWCFYFFFQNGEGDPKNVYRYYNNIVILVFNKTSKPSPTVIATQIQFLARLLLLRTQRIKLLKSTTRMQEFNSLFYWRHKEI